jgi:hypothetical protein
VNKLLLICMSVLVGGAIIGGLVVVGGPQHARFAQQDRQRVSDLRILHTHLMCLGHPRKPLPQALADDSYCPGARPGLRDVLTQGDPATGAPYVYHRLNDTAFEVCATLALDPAEARKAAFDHDTIALRANDTLCFIGDRAVSAD